MSETGRSGGWSLINTAPRDGTPVILWMVEDETPPSLPLTVGFWTIETVTGLGGWRIFGTAESVPFRVDDQIRAWKPLLWD
jgi:hypothetical protein